MKYIAKGKEPEVFAEWKAKANENWTPHYSDLRGDEKEAVYKALKAEQGGICAYCERTLMPNDYHIDHLNPQFRHDGDDLDYSNFVCSCLNQTQRGVPLHCGKLKGNKSIEITPFSVDCEKKFKFTMGGDISGTDAAAGRTIEALGLNIKKLIDFRRHAIEPFIDDMPVQDLEKFVEGYLTPSPTGELNPFYTTIVYLFGN